MIFNVAQLLKSEVGTTREYAVEESEPPFSDDARLTSPVRGDVQFIRTNRGILARAHLRTSVELTCSRCLELYVEDLPIEFTEEYVPVTDVITGQPANIPHESFTYEINDKHEIDLSPAVREYGLLTLPMKPLCRSDCAGLCPECGTNRNVHQCTCVTGTPDERLIALRALLNADDESN